jgi:hypothetical protein
MSFLKSIIFVAPLAVAGMAFAQTPHINDMQYVAAARCQVLMSSSELGRQDTRAIDALVKSQGSSRSEAVYDLADHARDDASRAVRHAGPFGRSALIAERDGACRSLADGATQSAAAEQARTSRTN